MKYVARHFTLAHCVAHESTHQLLTLALWRCVLHRANDSRERSASAPAEKRCPAELQRSTELNYALAASHVTIEGSLSCARMRFGPPQLLAQLLLLLLLWPPQLSALLPPPSCTHQQEVRTPLGARSVEHQPIVLERLRTPAQPPLSMPPWEMQHWEMQQ